MQLPGNTTDFHGFVGHAFSVDGCAVQVVEPKKALPGNPWIWRTMFWDAFPNVDIALLERGYFVAFIDVGDTFGSPDAMKRFDAFYGELTTKFGLGKRPTLEGLSRGGLSAYRWASANPQKVGCIYGDAPVCDLKMWLGGKGKGPGDPEAWQAAVRAYHFTSEQEMLAYKGNPVDTLAPLAAARVPIIHVYGDADTNMSPEENTGVVRERYLKMGGTMVVIVKKGCAHHPHGLADPAPIADFIVTHTGSGEARDKAALVAPRGNSVLVLPPGKW